MRKLIGIPIVHAESDLGSLGPAISKRSASLVGERRWAQHSQTVAAFWKSTEDYVKSLSEPNLKIYQDGLAADGELGRKVIEAAASKGSKNHQIILDLMGRGAEIRNTEDISLLLEERDDLIKLVQSASLGGTPPDASSLLEEQHRLDAKRDRHIADRINRTLREGETAILFLGAHHDVTPHLAKDIVVEWAKKREKVKEYFRLLISGQDENRYRQLSAYMASPVSDPERVIGAS